MQKLQFPEEINFTNYYYKNTKDTSAFNKKSIIKISKELSTYSNSLPMNYESSIYVRYM